MSITRIADSVYYEIALNNKKYKKVKTDANMPIESSLFEKLFQNEKKNNYETKEEKHVAKVKKEKVTTWEDISYSENWKEERLIGSKIDTVG